MTIIQNDASSDENDSIWGDVDELPSQEWTKMVDDYTNAGYREGITAGKEEALQEGFDDGYASVGAPLGQEVGTLRGMANALKAFLSTKDMQDTPELESLKKEITEISNGLSRLQLTDLAPPDLEAEAHAREHLEDENAAEKVKALNVEESLGRGHERPAMEEMKRLRGRLIDVLGRVGLEVNMS
ncbi:hypothetical protein M422DRAFT_161854 [Sphaerobolus stellatus SS14]|nr:hypothetical protein M422DRAFT_161854 [Sphaerobolus stellatus SS14]